MNGRLELWEALYVQTLAEPTIVRWASAKGFHRAPACQEPVASPVPVRLAHGCEGARNTTALAGGRQKMAGNTLDNSVVLARSPGDALGCSSGAPLVLAGLLRSEE